MSERETPETDQCTCGQGDDWPHDKKCPLWMPMAYACIVDDGDVRFDSRNPSCDDGVWYHRPEVDTRISELKRERDEAREERAWRPIESAPRDGNFIDIWDGYKRITDAWFSVKLDAFVHDSLPDMNGDVYDQKIHQPTNWMTLPKPPTGGPER